ncbi:hypothetical protein RHMOL_Rhmol11G0193900 [Rhododendron molle]|uniref:Uncharacterized protein n=2 Tax=Rhododendron molle TaxID=49168 RepID=A0ACC0LV09_RHOML|nr:hypothetical protein RHMOL_Rhmol11G0193900 [Rhododendron molle]KAI8532189.1 hypothetical protein RHMOL_Rhmol11G0193900 [Rhododendron molle]
MQYRQPPEKRGVTIYPLKDATFSLHRPNNLPWGSWQQSASYPPLCRWQSFDFICAMASRERPPSYLADKPLLRASIYVTVVISLSNMVHPKLIECRAFILRKLLKDAEAKRDKLKKQMEREKANELTHVCPSDTFGSGDGY